MIQILTGLFKEYYGIYNSQHQNNHRKVFGVMVEVRYAPTLTTEEKKKLNINHSVEYNEVI